MFMLYVFGINVNVEYDNVDVQVMPTKILLCQRFVTSYVTFHLSVMYEYITFCLFVLYRCLTFYLSVMSECIMLYLIDVQEMWKRATLNVYDVQVGHTFPLSVMCQHFTSLQHVTNMSYCNLSLMYMSLSAYHNVYLCVKIV